MRALIYIFVKLGLYKRKPLAHSAQNKKGFLEEVSLEVVKEVLRFSFIEVVEESHMHWQHALELSKLHLMHPSKIAHTVAMSGILYVHFYFIYCIICTQLKPQSLKL